MAQTPQTDWALLPHVMKDVERVLTSPLIPDGEKHDVLAGVVEKIVPEDENEAGQGI